MGTILSTISPEVVSSKMMACNTTKFISAVCTYFHFLVKEWSMIHVREFESADFRAPKSVSVK